MCVKYVVKVRNIKLAETTNLQDAKNIVNDLNVLRDWACVCKVSEEVVYVSINKS
jgi:hypothetical protein